MTVVISFGHAQNTLKSAMHDGLILKPEPKAILKLIL